MDTEEVKRSSHIDDGVPRLRLCPRSKLDDLLGCLEEPRHSRPRTVRPRTLECVKGRYREVKSHSGSRATIPRMLEYMNNYNKVHYLLSQSRLRAAGNLSCPAGEESDT